MPGLLRDGFSSSSSESGSFTENGAWAGIESSKKDAPYVAASYPGYSEKPLAEQLEPIAVCGMGKVPRNSLDLD